MFLVLSKQKRLKVAQKPAITTKIGNIKGNYSTDQDFFDKERSLG
jgi:hypothetical protein